MASEHGKLPSDGALFELLSRGNKDIYFMRKAPLSKEDPPLLNPFETRYERRPATLSEVRRTVPLNAPAFGRACEFEFEIAGDIFTDTTLLIDLPTWLPAPEAALNRTSGYLVRSATTGRQYGYTRGIGYFLFSKIQLYQDKLLLQEFSGDALWASRLSRGSLNQAWLDQTLTAQSDVSGATLYRNATPGRLRLPLPMLGGKKGVPSAAIKQQAFRLRCVLRGLDDIIECDDSTVARPNPWSETAFEVVASGGGATSFTLVPREQMAAPTLTLETRHIYLDPESREAVATTNHEIPYSVLYENPHTFGNDDYLTANDATATYPFFTRDLDARRPASRIFWFMRTTDDLQKGRRWATSGYKNPYWNQLSLIIAARDRETLWGPLVWNTLVPFSKEDRDPGFAIGEMNWDLGNGIGAPPIGQTPMGSVNFTTALRPTLLVSLRKPNADQIWGSKTMDFLTIVESWGQFVTDEGRGFLKYN
jgi:hypothetical protein